MLKWFSNRAGSNPTPITQSMLNDLKAAAISGDTNAVLSVLRKKSNQQKLELLKTPLTIYGLTALRFAAQHNKTEILSLILNSIDRNQRLDLLWQADNFGWTPLMAAASQGHIAAVTALLEDLSSAQRSMLFDKENQHNKRAIVIAYEQGCRAVVDLLIERGDILPANLRQQGIAVNDTQSTHTATVHDSLARSAIALMIRYVDGISPKDKNTLKIWVQGALADESDRANQEAVLTIMEKQSTQNYLIAFVDSHKTLIQDWAQLLKEEKGKEAAAKRAINRIYNNEIVDDIEEGDLQVSQDATYKESRTKLTLEQALTLVWVALKDDMIQADAQRYQLLIRNLFELQREYNLDEYENDDNLADESACPAGTFNKLISTLSGGWHPDVKMVVVNDNTVKAKAAALIAQLCDMTEYSKAEIAGLNKAFNQDHSYLISAIENKLKPKVMDALNFEFRDFVSAKILKKTTIEKMADEALHCPTARSTQLIAEKLNSFLAMQ